MAYSVSYDGTNVPRPHFLMSADADRKTDLTLILLVVSEDVHATRNRLE